ncbi:DUF370 domain-containing protein [Anoxybacter fermentans]|uniref:DUF370 domain-containing protein n=1 Tax=Anoxybacter fermentans TaxID=1323375 RepID=A0A3Q9HRT3_9FIRM|nr:extracellular matrix/biofilm biosynthesis regulator RemA family protein [Anoxybacter fermentans]AZR74307.1 DUF370 domain-containing protein [Anoxybacter fermentans]
MLLHIGNGHLIPTKDVVMIADYKSSMSSKDTQNFLKIANEEGFVKDYSEGSPKSFIVTNETIYLSLISSATLAKRINFINQLK